MTVHVAYGYGLFTGGLGAHYGAEAAGCTVIPMSGGQTEKQVQLIRDFAPDIIMVTPSYMLAILDEFRRLGYDPRSTSLRIGIFGAEPWSDGMRAEIESAFNLIACDIYGLSEVMGPGVAPRIWGHEGGADDLGRSLHCRDRGSGQRPGGRRWRVGRIGVHLTDEGSHAGDPLPHTRSDPAASRVDDAMRRMAKSAAARTTCWSFAASMSSRRRSRR